MVKFRRHDRDRFWFVEHATVDMQQLSMVFASRGRTLAVSLRNELRRFEAAEAARRKEAAEAREAALGPRELASLTLASPLQDFRLVARALGEDPVVRASTRNRIWYGVLLTLFYVTLALGVIYTGRTLYREAQLSRLKTDFVSLVSHELRTPLTSIRMFIDTLAMGRVTDPTEMQTVLDLLSKETTRLSGMIESVLDWSRIESGKKQYQRVVTPVSVIIETADKQGIKTLGHNASQAKLAPKGFPASKRFKPK
jgi:signal transduction histidine kinase